MTGDGNILAAGFRLSDTNANFLNFMALPDPYYPQQLPGTPIGNGTTLQLEEKMNDSGSLLYVPLANSVDIFDVSHATLAKRATLSEQIPSQIIDALAIDVTGENIFLLTNKGLTVVELDVVPLSIGSVAPATASAGTQVTVRGSGFVSGTTASLNGIAAVVSPVDGNTLHLVVPILASGPVQIHLSNPDGSTYSWDDAFTIP